MVNKVFLLGNVGKTPTIRESSSGTKSASFSLATSETFKNKEGEKQTITDWHSVILWRGLAEIAEKYVTKGSQVFIEGKLKTRSYEDKIKGKCYITEVIGDRLVLLGNKEAKADHEPDEPTVKDIDDDLPWQ